MNEFDIIQAVSRECGLPQYQTYEVLNSLASNIQKTLQKQGSVTLTGLGTFYSPNLLRKNDDIPSPGETIKYYVTHVVEWHPESKLLSPDGGVTGSKITLP